MKWAAQDIALVISSFATAAGTVGALLVNPILQRREKRRISHTSIHQDFRSLFDSIAVEMVRAREVMKDASFYAAVANQSSNPGAFAGKLSHSTVELDILHSKLSLLGEIHGIKVNEAVAMSAGVRSSLVGFSKDAAADRLTDEVHQQHLAKERYYQDGYNKAVTSIIAKLSAKYPT